MSNSTVDRTTEERVPPLRSQEEAAIDALPKVLAEIERLQRHWRVRVCRWWVTSVKPNAKLKHDRVSILVQAFTADDAMKLAREYAEAHAPIGPLFKGFEAQEAASVVLPIQL
jgi:hypothetical protein